jgi:folate-binding protein YgfZ
MDKIEYQAINILKVIGKDSKRYLNSRLTNNIKDLQINDSIHSAMINAQGKCQGIFDVLCISNEEFIIFNSFQDKEKIVKDLKQFLVADRVVVEDISEKLEDNSFDKAKIKSLYYYDVLKNNSYDYLLYLRVKNSYPIWGSEIFESTSIAELDYKKYCSFTKGCYVGQEVVERVDAMGKSPYFILPFVAEVSTNLELDNVLSFTNNSYEEKKWGFIRVKNSPNFKEQLSELGIKVLDSNAV